MEKDKKKNSKHAYDLLKNQNINQPTETICTSCKHNYS